MKTPEASEKNEQEEIYQHLREIAEKCRAMVKELDERNPERKDEIAGRKVSLNKTEDRYTVDVVGMNGDGISFVFSDREMEGMRIYFRSQIENKVTCICDANPEQEYARVLPSEIEVIRCEELLEKIMEPQENKRAA